MTRRPFRSMSYSIASAVSLALALPAASVAQTASTPAQAPALQDEKFELDIPAQPLGDALQAFARVARQQVSFDSAATAGKTSRPVKGRYTAQETLEQLLEGAGLKFRLGSQGVWLVTAESEAPARSSTGVGAIETSEVIVTGTHLRGVADTAAPSMVISRVDLEKTSYSSLGEVFRDLPQNLGEVSAGAGLATGASTVAAQNGMNVSGISLRGLGPTSTLTLVNGKRRAPSLEGRVIDISAIPLSMVDRVEIVTGGHSAIYGSDAVAGVVNITTRRKFDGVEVQAYADDSSHPGGQHIGVSTVAGASYDRGGFAIAYDYSDQEPLDLAATGVPRETADGTTLARYDTKPDVRQHSALLSGQYKFTDRLELYGDAHYTHSDEKDSFYTTNPFFVSFTDAATKTESYSASVGLRGALSPRWNFDVSGLLGQSDATHPAYSEFIFPPDPTVYPAEFAEEDKSSVYGGTATLDGSVSLGALTPRLATGVDVRKEKLEEIQLQDGALSTPAAGDRTVRSVFAEALIPLAAGRERPALQRLDLSLGTRYEDYSDFGDTTNYQAGLVWQPASSFTFRGTYSTAFRAPDLFNLYRRDTRAYLLRVNDPATGQPLPVLMRLGSGNPGLGPEKARTWTAGLDWTPEISPSTRISASYFEIRYRDRLETPSADPFASQDGVDDVRFPGLVDRTPDLAQVQSILDTNSRPNVSNLSGFPYVPASGAAGLLALPGLVTFENRVQNIALEKVNGLDLQVVTGVDSPIGALTFGFNGTYTFSHDRKITSTSPTIALLDVPGRPVDLRFRVDSGWTRGPYGAFIAVNYVDSYTDTVAIAPADVGSWTTVSLTFRFDGSQVANAGRVVRGLMLTAGADNLFAEDPPTFLSNSSGLGYDPVNANAFGRLVSVRARVHW